MNMARASGCNPFTGAARLYFIARMIRRLTTKTEPGNQLAIPFLVLRFQIVKQLAPFVHHLQQTLTAVVIFFVLAEVLGEFRNTCRQECYLYLGRSRIRFSAGIFSNNAVFLLTRQ